MSLDIALFSDWTLALLPRLLIYPGGLWMLAALLVFRLATDGVTSLKPTSLARDLGRANILALATAWAALALLPLPGAEAMPFPPDTFSLAGLLALSLSADVIWGYKQGRRNALAGVATTLAIMAPVAGRRALIIASGIPSLSDWLSLLAVGVALATVAHLSRRDLSGGVRWLAWLALGAAPFRGVTPMPAALWVSLAYAAALLALAVVNRVLDKEAMGKWALATMWSLAGLSLVVALME